VYSNNSKVTSQLEFVTIFHTIELKFSSFHVIGLNSKVNVESIVHSLTTLKRIKRHSVRQSYVSSYAFILPQSAMSINEGQSIP